MRGQDELCLISFCGNLTESNNSPKIKLIADPQELFRFLGTFGIELTNLLFTDDDVMFVTLKYVVEE